MKKLFAIAAFLLASTAAQAQYTFEYGGRPIRIDPDRGTVSIPGVYDNSGRRTKRSRSDQDGDRTRKQQPPEQAKIDPQAPAAASPAPTEKVSPPAAKSEPAPVVATAPPSAPALNPVTPAVQSANTPLGVWLTEEKEGRVRIEQCGGNLCGYSVDAKSNQNGEQILINMKPGKDSKWSRRIHDPNTARTS